MMDFGPQIAIVDDRPDEVQGIFNYLKSLNIGFEFYNADIIEQNYPKVPLETVELIFLDLYYSEDFEPYQCAKWIDDIVPEDKQYELVIWSKDSHRTHELMAVLVEINKVPRFHITKQKSDYNKENGIKQLLEEIKTEFKEVKELKVDIFISEIIYISDDFIILNCLLDKEINFFQIRKFEKTPMIHFKNFEVGTFLKVKITTSTGERNIEFIEQFDDHSEIFEQKNIFLKFKGTPIQKSQDND
jgi:hypothetical protein